MRFVFTDACRLHDAIREMAGSQPVTTREVAVESNRRKGRRK